MKQSYDGNKLKIAQSFSAGDCLTMAIELFDEKMVKAAELWLKIAEEKYGKNKESDTIEMEMLDIKKEIHDFKSEENQMKRFQKLCTKSETTGHYQTFKNASTRCRYVQDGKNPLFNLKIEELSQEPIVYVIHDFLSKEEVKDILKKSASKEFDIAPVVGDDDNSDTYSDARVANSHYIDEDEDAQLGEQTKKIKIR